jgi:two-component system, NarL family, sensor histidine kinase DegS
MVVTRWLVKKVRQRNLLNPVFGLLLLVCLLLVALYQFWPWRTLSSPLYELALLEMRVRFIGVLLLIPVIAAAFWSWRACLITSVVSVVGLLPTILTTMSVNNVIANVTMLLIPFIVCVIVFLQLQWRERQRSTFEQLQSQQKLFISKTFEIQEEERRHLAAELHDQTIQALLAIANSANDIATGNVESEVETRQRAEWMKNASLDIVDDLRKICLALRPSALDDLGLEPALKSLVSQVARESQMDIRLVIDGKAKELAPQFELTIFRLVQEGLNNIRQHARAAKAVIGLHFRDDSLGLSIEDDGEGFRIPDHLHTLTKKGKLGLVGMRERVEYLGGTFAIDSKRGEGTTILMEMKLQSREPGLNPDQAPSETARS